MSSIRNAPPSMIYNQRQVPAVDAKMTVRRFDATVGTVFSGAGQNEARIPVSGMDAFLDTNKGYLQFKVTSTDTGSSKDGDGRRLKNSFHMDLRETNDRTRIRWIVQRGTI